MGSLLMTELGCGISSLSACWVLVKHPGTGDLAINCEHVCRGAGPLSQAKVQRLEDALWGRGGTQVPLHKGGSRYIID